MAVFTSYANMSREELEAHTRKLEERWEELRAWTKQKAGPDGFLSPTMRTGAEHVLDKIANLERQGESPDYALLLARRDTLFNDAVMEFGKMIAKSLRRDMVNRRTS